MSEVWSEFTPPNDCGSQFIVLKSGVGLNGGNNPLNTFNLFPADFDSIFNFSFELETDTPFDKTVGLAGSTGSLALKVINQTTAAVDSFKASLAPAEKAVTEQSKVITSRWQNLPAFKDISPLKFSSELRFEFWYGMKGLFNAATEVVFPIRNLVKWFANSHDKDGILNNNQVPLAGAIFGGLAGQVVAGVTSGQFSTEDTKEEKEAKEKQETVDLGIIDKAFNRAAALVGAYNKAVQTEYNKGSWRAICSVSNSSNTIHSPAFVVKGVSWSYDMSNLCSGSYVDSTGKTQEYSGYPLRGFVSLNGCQTVKVCSSNLIHQIA
jgi:hypothetical protein